MATVLIPLHQRPPRRLATHLPRHPPRSNLRPRHLALRLRLAPRLRRPKVPRPALRRRRHRQSSPGVTPVLRCELRVTPSDA